LSRTGFPAGRLELEITESAMVRDIGAAQRTLGGLRAAGIRIALDDFGTGYSSLFHLRNFKVDRLKIDRSFVESMTTDSDSAAIVKALIGLGEGLGLEVTAEGVETLQQRRMLETQGCHHAQGFYYGHALPAAGVRLSLEQGS
jgi:EAL domain-containing protein (putative c-di-GMP-specific phosphodiesterase class I)